jgi:hypothetical protein
MIFYKNLYYSVAISAFIVLSILAFIMYYAKKNQMYPPIIQECPDYFSLSSDGKCTYNPDAWTLNRDFKTQSGDVCTSVDFKKEIYIKNPGGYGPTSGACQKQTWAKDCGVTWDGITTNPYICYNDYNPPT